MTRSIPQAPSNPPKNSAKDANGCPTGYANKDSVAVFLPPVKTLARILSTPPSDLLLLAEAFLLLHASRIALKRIPLSRLVDWLRRPGHGYDVLESEKTAIRVRWAILAVARRRPGSFVCFPQSLAAYAMLRRRSIPSVLNYGVNRSPSNELRAHTWLKVGELIVVGGEEAAEFTVVSTFP